MQIGLYTVQNITCLYLKSFIFFLLFDTDSEGRSMDYGEVSSAFSKLVETHFLQRCPPTGGAATKESATPATPATPSAPASTTPPKAESFPDCYKVPHVTLTGRGKRQLSSEDGEDQRNAKKARMDTEVDIWNMFSTHKLYFHYML